jgi:adenosylhomocysteine nucleosidase
VGSIGDRPGAERVVIFAPMKSEMRPIVELLDLTRTGEQGGLPVYGGRVGSTDVVLTGTGVGPAPAEAAAERVLGSTPVDRVIVSGIAGGLSPVSDVGDLIVPEEVVDAATGERFRATATGGATLGGTIRMGDGSDYSLGDRDVERLVEAGFTALDMETAAIARVCLRHGVPWLAFRAISDMAGDASLGPAVMTMVNEDGSPRPLAALRYVVARPHRIPDLVRLGRDARAAATAAARATVRCLDATSAGPDPT